MNAKDAMIEHVIESEQRMVLQQEIMDRQAALIREYERYVTLLKAMLQRHAT